MNVLFRLFSRIGRPKFCRECGATLATLTERGAGRFSNEMWAVLECPNWPKTPGRLHYSHVIEWKPAPAKFDPMTGAPR